MKNQSIIRKYDSIEGVYGERYEVNTKDKKLTDLFELISLWTSKRKHCDDGSYDITYELPIDQKLEDNPLLMRIIRNNNAIII